MIFRSTLLGSIPLYIRSLFLEDLLWMGWLLIIFLKRSRLGWKGLFKRTR